jgi:hypothetical protein
VGLNTALIAAIVYASIICGASRSNAQAGDALAILGEALQKAKHCLNRDGSVGEEFCQPAHSEAIKNISYAIVLLKKDMGQ